MTRVAVVTLDGFNEIDSFIASYMLGRVDRPDWSVAIASPTPQVTSMNGVTVTAQMSLDELPEMDAVLVGSGSKTRAYVADPAFLASLRLDPTRQVVGSQCSGALLLAKLGLLDGVPICTDLITKPWVVEAGARVVDQPFFAAGNVGHRRRLPVEPIPRRVDHPAARRPRDRPRGAVLRRPRRSEGRARRPRPGSRHVTSFLTAAAGASV